MVVRARQSVCSSRPATCRYTGVETAASASCQHLGTTLPPGASEGRGQGAAYLAPADTDARREALARSFWLVREIQGGGTEPSAIDKMLDLAERREWPEVVLAALYAACVLARETGDGSLPEAIERLRLRAEADSDPAMLALALALRARVTAQSRESTRWVAADDDLARATVMLESGQGGAKQRASAHNSCAIVYGQRRLWELEDQQYAAAEELLADCQDSPLPSTVLYNRAELQLDWACAMREIGDADGVRQHCRAGAATSAAAKEVPGMPSSWRHELIVNDLLLAAVGGADVADEARRLLTEGPPGPEGAHGYLHLAVALSPGRPEATAEAAERAIATIDPGLGPTEYDLALRVAAELEAAAGNRQSAGLRCAQHQTELRWGSRLSTLAAMESLLHGERLRTENDQLSRHAHLDELTGLANRRGLNRYLTGLRQRGCQQLAMLLVDIDGFKQVNDRYGHSAGDDTLVRLAAILSANIRLADLAVRLGGDEFALVLADTDLVIAARRADAIMTAMSARPWRQATDGFAVTVSVGLAGGHPDQSDDITARADAAMYRAKAAGGSQTVAA
jgi:diguanylate cyclase (GGDEF)-like protein